MTVLKS